MELVRLLLLRVEGEEEVDLSEYSEQQQGYHLHKMRDAGLVTCNVIQDVMGEYHVSPAILNHAELTWEGHDFLDVARSQTIWKKAMTKVKATTGTVTFDVLKALLTALAKEGLGI